MSEVEETEAPLPNHRTVLVYEEGLLHGGTDTSLVQPVCHPHVSKWVDSVVNFFHKEAFAKLSGSGVDPRHRQRSRSRGCRVFTTEIVWSNSLELK